MIKLLKRSHTSKHCKLPYCRSEWAARCIFIFTVVLPGDVTCWQI